MTAMRTDPRAKPEPNTRFDILASPLFVASLCLLIANDWIFKPAFHNWVTGKLSDFAGLAAFSLFACALVPRCRWLLAALITAGFAYWKSSHAQGAIDAFNDLMPFSIGRTIDYSDFIALPAIWISCYLVPRLRAWPSMRVIRVAIGGISVVAFTATSVISNYVARQSVDLPIAGSRGEAEAQLTAMLDELATRNGLVCTVCEPLSSGRLYKGETSQVLLTARYDPEPANLLYDIRTQRVNKENSAAVDALKNQLQQQLQSRFAGLKFETPARTKSKNVIIAVYKHQDRALNSYGTPANQRDVERTRALMQETAKEFGMRQESPRSYSLGPLLGPGAYYRQVLFTSYVADQPLVGVEIYCDGDKCLELQKRIADDIKQRLQREFGADRARPW
jgi:hypothetical protein